MQTTKYTLKSQSGEIFAKSRQTVCTTIATTLKWKTYSNYFTKNKNYNSCPPFEQAMHFRILPAPLQTQGMEHVTQGGLLTHICEWTFLKVIVLFKQSILCDFYYCFCVGPWNFGIQNLTKILLGNIH